MKTVKVKFLGFWPGFVPEEFAFYKILAEHFVIELSDEPDFLFYSVFCENKFDYLAYDCVRIFYSGENVSPNFNECDYAIGFDEITYNDRYLNFPLFLLYAQLQQAQDKHLHITPSFLQGKTEFCNFIVGNGKGQQLRTDIFHALQAYKPVVSAGTYLNNRNGEAVTTEDAKLALQRTCKFTIAYESVAQRGFVTEKILHAFAAGTVPIYYGNADIEHIFNPDAFINAHACETLDDVVARVREVDEDPAKYEQMLTTPAFLNENYAAEKFAALEAFLLNIVGAPPAQAYRRPMKFIPIYHQQAILEGMHLMQEQERVAQQGRRRTGMGIRLRKLLGINRK
ncbi:glycosyltransferase family 10 [Ruminococcaceae bacterium OttesenSCG-928-N02]|nr:glycosyltransferase family 10 [Ruminococcaceae bacterium OttesenSCG-928-N02]